MSATAHMRGHPVFWDESNQVWCWDDSLTPTAQWGGEEKPCIQCGLTADLEDGVGGADPCIGVIEGAVAACCGHGVEQGVIVWPNISTD